MYIPFCMKKKNLSVKSAQHRVWNLWRIWEKWFESYEKVVKPVKRGKSLAGRLYTTVIFHLQGKYLIFLEHCAWQIYFSVFFRVVQRTLIYIMVNLFSSYELSTSQVFCTFYQAQVTNKHIYITVKHAGFNFTVKLCRNRCVVLSFGDTYIYLKCSPCRHCDHALLPMPPLPPQHPCVPALSLHCPPSLPLPPTSPNPYRPPCLNWVRYQMWDSSQPKF